MLTARVGGFMKGMNRAAKRTRSFGRSIAKISRGMVRFGTIAAGVAVGALVLMTRNAFKTIDATAKLAFTLGLATKELTGYQFAAAISGVSSEQLATAFKRMSKNISDAADAGLSTAIRAFEDLGLSAEGLKKLSPDKQFKKIADRLAGMGDQAKKVRVALDLFGRSGLGLLKLTQDGAEGIAKLQRQAQKLGLTFNEIDAGKIEAANDAITRARSAFQGIINQLAIKLAPLVEALANGFTNWAMAGEGAAARVQSAFQDVAISIGFVGDVIEDLELRWLKFARVTEKGEAKRFKGESFAEGLAITARVKELENQAPFSVRFQNQLADIAKRAHKAAEVAA
ncbi:MAG: hypothetical protein IID41_07910, partial [Planctomycetes bacterium]|nr:hypothetical protein [Planctomycetota bacterium]